MTVTEFACREAGLVDDVRLFARRARFAGWDLLRLADELKVTGFKQRFDEATAAGVAADLGRRVDRYMRDALLGGPSALALRPVPELAAMVAPSLRPEATTYDPFREGGRLVCGPTGVGKSVAGIAALRRMHPLRPADMNALWDTGEIKWSCTWVRAFELAKASLETAFGSGEAELVTEARSAQFLVLDDLGWESKRAGADDAVAEVIAARYDTGRVTYATTGMRLPKFIDRYGSAVVRRLVEAGNNKGKVIDLWTDSEAR
jgi:hypothetical protein